MKRTAGLAYGSVCSGIEAVSTAWDGLGFRPAWFSEIDAFPGAVLERRFPRVPNLGDMTQLGKSEVFKRETIDVLVGGTPCQSFSVAGLRQGLDDPRGNLALVFLEIARRKRPRWLLWENVPGVLSSGQGRDFGAFLGTLAKLGYGWAYRVLDAQHFGVPQRRRRVFVVGHLGDWRRAAAVLFERESLSGNPAPRKAPRKGVAALTAAGVGTCGADDNQAQAGHLIARALNAKGGSGRRDGDTETFVTHALRAEGFDASEDGTGRGTPIIPLLEIGKGTSSRGEGPNGSGIGKGGDPMFTLQAGAQHGVIAPVPIDMRQARRGATMTNKRAPDSSGGAPGTGIGKPGDPAPTVARSQVPAIAFSSKDHGADAGKTSPTLRAGGHSKSHANAGVPPAVCFQQNSRSEVRKVGGDGRKTGAVTSGPGAQCQNYVCLSPSVINGRQDPIHGKTALPLDTDPGSQAVVFESRFARNGRGAPSKLAPPLKAQSGVTGKGDASPLLCYEHHPQDSRVRQAAVAPQLNAKAGTGGGNLPLVGNRFVVRRLTPRECERLQGFPDDYTLISWRGKAAADCPDGPRYKSLGNSMAVPVMRWLGERLQRVEALRR